MRVHIGYLVICIVGYKTKEKIKMTKTARVKNHYHLFSRKISSNASKVVIVFQIIFGHAIK